jgi:hypothetical protein
MEQFLIKMEGQFEFYGEKVLQIFAHNSVLYG